MAVGVCLVGCLALAASLPVASLFGGLGDLALGVCAHATAQRRRSI
ncbi:MAG: hypothetical protein ACR2G7_09115 [Acidimicrobiales bacterium]